jgi:hypothetical protein
VTKNRVFFSRASDGKTVRARPSKATKTRIEVIVPPAITTFLADNGTGGKKATRFQIAIFTKLLGRYTAKSRSPIILPVGVAPITGAPGGPGALPPGATTPAPPTGPPAPPPPDCNGNGIPDSSDTSDSDGDGLPDNLEVSIGTNPCNKDTDSDGVIDGYEYYSAKDMNPNFVPCKCKRPYPNPLDGSDTFSDFAGDGLTMARKFALWSTFFNGVFPTSPTSSFPYSAGNPYSPAPNGAGAMDLNGNGQISDDEKDADNDRVPNWVELALGEPDPTTATGCVFAGPDSRFTSCNAGGAPPWVPNGNTFKPITKTTTGAPAPPTWFQLEFLNPMTLYDGSLDGNDDMDHDGVSNIREITGTNPTNLGVYSNPVDPCDPDPNVSACPTHPSHN